MYFTVARFACFVLRIVPLFVETFGFKIATCTYWQGVHCVDGVLINEQFGDTKYNGYF